MELSEVNESKRKMLFYDGGAFKDCEVITEKVQDCSNCSECRRTFNIPLSPVEMNVLETMGPEGFRILKKNPDGSCFYLIDGKCSIYEGRPMACREYSCVGDPRINRL